MRIFHITFVTYNSRISQRMIDYRVRKGQGIILNLQEEIILTTYISQILSKYNYKCYAYNICSDHVHIILGCKLEKIAFNIQRLKSISSRKFNIAMGKTTPSKKKNTFQNSKKHTQTRLWARGYYVNELNSDQKLYNALQYIQQNRVKHNLPKSKLLERVIEDMTIDPQW